MQVSEEDLQPLTGGIWQWQPNKDPWSKSEEPQWKSSSPKQNLFSEKHNEDGQKEADKGDGIASLEHLLQINKQDKDLQRPIGMIDWMEDEEFHSRGVRYHNVESPKPVNKIFGSLWDFIHFFSKRSLEIRDFAKLFKDIEKSKNINELNNKICPEIQNGIIKEFHKLNLDKSSESVSLLKKKIQFKERESKEKLILSFQKQFQSFEDFFAQILRVYTIDTFLYRNLNKYLRDENWVEISDLLPYAFCLCKAFFNKKLTNKEPATKQPFTTLYRGTVLDTEAIQFFQNQEVPDFSWYSVTSTTKRKEIAEKFIPNPKKEKKHRVLFVIHLSRLSHMFSARNWSLIEREEDYVKYLEVSKYSAYASEEEVILPPGSVFQFLELWNEKDTILIRIKLKEDISSKDLIYKGLLMQGAIQTETMREKKARITCLKGEILCEALKNISGNTLIEEVEFYLCVFDHFTFWELIKTSMTIRNTTTIKFISCKHQDPEENSNRIPLSITDSLKFAVQIYEIKDFYKIFRIYKHWISLEKLFIVFKKATNQELISLCSQTLQHLVHLKILSLDLSNCFEITDEGVNKLGSNGLKYLIKLERLNLNFSNCSEISMRGIISLFSEGLRALPKLKSLNLNFSSCYKVSENLISNVCSSSLQHMTDLKFTVKVSCPILERFPFAFRILSNRFFKNKLESCILKIPLSKTSSEEKHREPLVEALLMDADLESEKETETETEPIQDQNLQKYIMNRRSSIEHYYYSLRQVKLAWPNPFENRRLSIEGAILNLFLYETHRRSPNPSLIEQECQACFTSLDLDFCPFWMRDKAFDYLMFKELTDLIQHLSQKHRCSEKIVETLFLLCFEQIVQRMLDESMPWSDCIALYLGKEIEKDLPPIRPPIKKSYFLKRSKGIPEKGKRFAVSSKKYRGYRFY